MLCCYYVTQKISKIKNRTNALSKTEDYQRECVDISVEWFLRLLELLRVLENIK